MIFMEKWKKITFFPLNDMIVGKIFAIKKNQCLNRCSKFWPENRCKNSVRNHCENSFKLKAIEVKTLNMPEKDFTDIKFETKIGRMMAFTMTKIRNHVIAKVNQRAKLLQEFKDEGLSHMMSIDILQEIQIFYR